MKKYLCMMEGCDFVTEDEEEARDHMGMGEDHIMVELEITNEGNVSCKTLV